MKIKILVSIIACTLFCSVAGLHNPIIMANENSPDANYAKLLMNNLYSHRDIAVVDNDTIEVNESIFYNIPANHSFKIDNMGELYVEFEKTENGIKYKSIEYREKLSSNNRINLLGKTYNIRNLNSNEIVLVNEIKEITTNKSFEYDGYYINIKAISSSGCRILVDIIKDGVPIGTDIKMNKKYSYIIKGTNITIYFEDIIKNGRNLLFSFKLYKPLRLINNEDFALDKNFTVELNDNAIASLCKNDYILTLKYKNPEKLPPNFKVFNYEIKPANIDGNIVCFDVLYKNNYKIKKEDVDETKYIGNNIFVVKKGNRLYIYKDGMELNRITDYMGSKIILDDDILKSDGDIILVGGPISNNITKKINNKLIVPITNENPGENTGIIQKIKNPYNPNYYIYVLAGSDRYGTKACVMALLNGLYNNENILKVKLENNKPVVIKN